MIDQIAAPQVVQINPMDGHSGVPINVRVTRTAGDIKITHRLSAIPLFAPLE
jgi:hypothetical protein